MGQATGDFRYELSLRIWHPSLPPEEFSEALSLVPDTGWAAGSPSKRFDGSISTRPVSYWSARLTQEEPLPLGVALHRACRMLQPYAGFVRQIVSTGGRLEFFVGWFSGRNSGEVFSHSLLSDIAELHIDLALDVYGVASDAPVMRDDTQGRLSAG